MQQPISHSKSARLARLEECIMRGFSVRRTAVELGCSVRSVERYLKYRRETLQEMGADQALVARQMIMDKALRDLDAIHELIDDETARLKAAGKSGLSSVVVQAYLVACKIMDTIGRVSGADAFGKLTGAAAAMRAFAPAPPQKPAPPQPAPGRCTVEVIFADRKAEEGTRRWVQNANGSGQAGPGP